MALKTPLTAEEYEALDEGLREHYSEARDGNYILDLEGKTASEERLENALARWKEAAGSSDPTRLKRRIEEAEEIRDRFADLDPDEAKSALARLKELEEGRDDGHQKEIERIRETLTKQSEKVVQEKDEQIQRLTSHVERREIDQALDAAMEKAEIIPSTRKAVKALLRERGPRVVWEDGEPRGAFQGDLGEELDVETYVLTWAKTDEAKAFLPASGNQGSGAGTGSGGTGYGRSNPWRKETWNITEQGKIVQDNPALAKQLAAAAGRRLGVA